MCFIKHRITLRDLLSHFSDSNNYPLRLNRNFTRDAEFGKTYGQAKLIS